jgi:beta-phosphoglucomutase
MTKKTFLFDLDGVLVDTKKIHEEAMIAALAFYGFNISSDFHRDFLEGLPTFTKIRKLNEHLHLNLTEELKKKIFEKKQSISNIKIREYQNPNLALQECFEYLKVSNCNIAICSNTRRPTLDFLVSKIGLSKLIDLSLSSEDVITPKPSAEIFEKAIAFFNADKKETFIFEDSEVGLKAAAATNCHVIAITDIQSINKRLIQSLIHKCLV